MDTYKLEEDEDDDDDDDDFDYISFQKAFIRKVENDTKQENATKLSKRKDLPLPINIFKIIMNLGELQLTWSVMGDWSLVPTSFDVQNSLHNSILPQNRGRINNIKQKKNKVSSYSMRYDMDDPTDHENDYLWWYSERSYYD